MHSNPDSLIINNMLMSLFPNALVCWVESNDLSKLPPLEYPPPLSFLASCQIADMMIAVIPKCHNCACTDLLPFFHDNRPDEMLSLKTDGIHILFQ